MSDNGSPDWQVIGHIDVDSGMVLVIDPSRLDDTYEAHGERYEKELLPIAGETGSYGAGVASATGYGDDSYDVEARFITDERGARRVAELRVRFI